MDSFTYPHWDAISDETAVSDTRTFSDCEQAVAAFASRAGGSIVDRKYSVSDQWGRVLRANVGLSHRAGFAATTLVTCWSGAGPGVRMAVEIEGCGPQQPGC
jgi:hypothetical protein